MRGLKNTGFHQKMNIADIADAYYYHPGEIFDKPDGDYMIYAVWKPMIPDLEEIAITFFDMLEESIRESVDELNTKDLARAYLDEYKQAIINASSEYVRYLKKTYTIDEKVIERIYNNEVPNFMHSIYTQVANEMIDAFEQSQTSLDLDLLVYDQFLQGTGYSLNDLLNSSDVRTILENFFSSKNMSKLLNKVVDQLIYFVNKCVLKAKGLNETDALYATWIKRVDAKMMPVIKALVYLMTIVISTWISTKQRLNLMIRDGMRSMIAFLLSGLLMPCGEYSWKSVLNKVT